MTTRTVATDAVGELSVRTPDRPDLPRLTAALTEDGAAQARAAAASSVFESFAWPEGRSHDAVLERVVAAVAGWPATKENAWSTAVLLNMMEVLARGAATDYLQLAALTAVAPGEVALVQDRCDELAGSPPGRPLTTSLLIALSNARQVRHALNRAGFAEQLVDSTVAACARAAFRLLLVGVENYPPLPLPRSAAGLRAIVTRPQVDVWRQHVASIAAEPWSHDPVELEALADEAGIPLVARATEECVRHFRRVREEDERAQVAAEVRGLVIASGVSQRVFAHQVGTSPSRLSTYVNAKSMPSASMMLRMRIRSAELARGAAALRRGEP